MGLFNNKSKQQQATGKGVYGRKEENLPLQDGNVKDFHLPTFNVNEESIMRRIEERSALIARKVNDGEMDSQNVDMGIFSFGALMGELDELLAVWKKQCEIQLKHLSADLSDKAEVRGISLAANDDLAKRLEAEPAQRSESEPAACSGDKLEPTVRPADELESADRPSNVLVWHPGDSVEHSISDLANRPSEPAQC